MKIGESVRADALLLRLDPDRLPVAEQHCAGIGQPRPLRRRQGRSPCFDRGQVAHRNHQLGALRRFQVEPVADQPVVEGARIVSAGSCRRPIRMWCAGSLRCAWRRLPRLASRSGAGRAKANAHLPNGRWWSSLPDRTSVATRARFEGIDKHPRLYEAESLVRPKRSR
jgi:hypothetical protein